MLPDRARTGYLLRNGRLGESRHLCSVKASLSLKARDRKERRLYAFTLSFCEESDPLRAGCISYSDGGSSIFFL